MQILRSISAVVAPTESLRGRIEAMYPDRHAPANGRVGQVLDDIVRVDALAGLITEAIRANQRADGSLDEYDVGAFIVSRLGLALKTRPTLFAVGGPLTPAESADLEAKVVDAMAARALGKLLTEAIERTQAKDGLTDTKKVAAYVFRRMKEASR